MVSLPSAVVTIALALVAFLATHCDAGAFGFDAPSACLTKALGDAKASFTTNGEAGDDDTSIVFMGCHAKWIVGMQNLNGSSTAPDAPPNITEAVECATACQALRPKNEKAQFVYWHAQCHCVARSDYVKFPTGSKPTLNQLCDSSDVRVFELDVSCPLNVTFCGETSGCKLSDGCCVVDNDAAQLIPAFYRAIVQWVAIVIIGLAVLEGIVYAVVRNIVRRRREEEWRRESMPLRENEEAGDVAERLMAAFPPSTQVPPRPMIDDQSADCVICLEGLGAGNPVVLPCTHELHGPCLRDYLAHQLVKGNDVACPLCRAAVIEGDPKTGLPRVVSAKATINVESL